MLGETLLLCIVFIHRKHHPLGKADLSKGALEMSLKPLLCTVDLAKTSSTFYIHMGKVPDV